MFQHLSQGFLAHSSLHKVSKYVLSLGNFISFMWFFLNHCFAYFILFVIVTLRTNLKPVFKILAWERKSLAKTLLYMVPCYCWSYSVSLAVTAPKCDIFKFMFSVGKII